MLSTLEREKQIGKIEDARIMLEDGISLDKVY